MLKNNMKENTDRIKYDYKVGDDDWIIKKGAISNQNSVNLRRDRTQLYAYIQTVLLKFNVMGIQKNQHQKIKTSKSWEKLQK